MVADGVDRLARHLHAVGPHVGDEADGLAADVDAFIELLRHAHRLLRAEAELARGFLLQGRGGEGRRRVAPDPACFSTEATENVPASTGRLGARALASFVQVELVELAAVQMGQPGGEGGALRGR